MKITSQEFGRGPVTTRRFATLAAAAAYIADRWQGDEYRDGPASFHTDYCTYQCHGFTLADVRPAKPVCVRSAAQQARRCTEDGCEAGAHCRTCGGHFLDYHNGNLRGHQCDSCRYDPASDEDGPGVNGPEPVFQGGLDNGETGFENGVHWSDPAADFPRY
jgi:hypothetical protein